MTTIGLVANDQLLTVVLNPKLTSGDQNTTDIHVDFSEDWDGFAKSAVFFTSNDTNTVYEKVMTNNTCIIPAEVMVKRGILYIGVRGVNASENEIKTTSLVKYIISEGAPSGTGIEIEPTADVYHQLLTAYEKAENAINQGLDDCKTAITAEENARKLADATEKSERQSDIANEKSERQSAIATEKAERQAEIAVERARIDALTHIEEGSTTADAELIDIRVGYTGKIYTTAGEAVRSQLSDIGDIIYMKHKLNIGTLIDKPKYNPQVRYINFNFTAKQDFILKSLEFPLVVKTTTSIFTVGATGLVIPKDGNFEFNITIKKNTTTVYNGKILYKNKLPLDTETKINLSLLLDAYVKIDKDTEYQVTIRSIDKDGYTSNNNIIELYTYIYNRSKVVGDYQDEFVTVIDSTDSPKPAMTFIISTNRPFKGDKGDQGEQGIQGIQGIQGEKGEKGDRGEQGLKGVKGDRGLKGDSYILTDADKTEIAQKVKLPTKTSELENDSNFVSDANYIHTDNNFTTTEKTKLGSLANYDDTAIKKQISNKQDKLSKEQLENIAAVPNKIDQSQVGNGLKFADGQLQLDIPVASDSTTYGGVAQ